MRMSWDDYFIKLSFEVATRATCLRKQVGAIIVRDRRILATGYNGSPPGQPHCTDIGCLMDNNHCIRTIHAEQNAILQCSSYGVATKGATLYCTFCPCYICAKTIIGSAIAHVYYPESSENKLSRELFDSSGIVVTTYV